MKSLKRTLLLCLLLALAGLTKASAGNRAFPGAEGFGRFASGGRGGKVLEVTNLNDAGDGSFRAAIDAVGPRTIVFRVSGTIKLREPLTIHSGDVTIAGQTAPGDGICIRDYPVKIAADNVIIRYVRFRLGDSASTPEDALSGESSLHQRFRNIIIDHCSMSWGLDECSSFYDVSDFTMQWCFITESLNRSSHPKGDHGYGGIWGGWRSSFHHNLIAHHTSRTPRFNGSRYTSLPDSELVDFRNNVVYNWGYNSAYGGERGNQNVVANYFKHGPATKREVRFRILDPSDSLGNWFVAENFVWGSPAISQDNWNGGVQGEFAGIQKMRRQPEPFPYAPITIHTAQEAFGLVLEHGGACLPHRDVVDSRIVREVQTSTATFGGTWGRDSGIIDSQIAVGGWPRLQSAAPLSDSDHDGIPDVWETERGLNPDDPSDGAAIATTGYSNLELYLNSIVTDFSREKK